MPLFRCLPLLMHSACSTKSANCLSVCRSPGPFLTFSQPSGVTVNFDFSRFGSPVNCFQPARPLPLNSAVGSSGRRQNRLIVSMEPAGTSAENGVTRAVLPKLDSVTFRFPELLRLSPDTEQRALPSGQAEIRFNLKLVNSVVTRAVVAFVPPRINLPSSTLASPSICQLKVVS